MTRMSKRRLEVELDRIEQECSKLEKKELEDEKAWDACCAAKVVSLSELKAIAKRADEREEYQEKLDVRWLYLHAQLQDLLEDE